MPGRLLGTLVAALWVAAFAMDRGRDWVAATEIPALSLPVSVEVVDRNGILLRAYTVADGRWRMGVALAEVDPRYIAMLVGYEDKRFWSHPGVDWRSMLRAMGQALRHGRVVSGGSTLTMQVARLLEESGTGKMDGKLRQIRLALALEQRLTKEQILQLYLHLAPFGGNLEGVRAASLAYFGKEPRRLTPAEAALLVAIPQAPESRRPDRHPARATDARGRVLARALGNGVITEEEARATQGEVVPAARKPVPMLAAHLADRVVKAQPSIPRHQVTLEAGLQKALEALAKEAVAGKGDQMQIAILAADHQSGEVLASVGSAGFTEDQRQGFVDMTRALRSPGSTLKPLVYALAFDEGLAHPETLIDDKPVQFGTYAPQNFDKIYRGTIRLREALQLSLNIPVVRMTEALGPAKLIAAMRRAGMQPELKGDEPGLAISLGGVGVTLEDMVQLYAALARGGVALPLRHDGAAGEGADAGQRVVSAVAAWQVADILSGLAPPPGAPENRLAYKTGTSYGHRDAWAIGFDGRHVVGVWMGRADGTPVPGAFGADTAAPVLFQAMGRISRSLTPLPPPPPATLLVSNADLPQPLQRFRSRNAAFQAADAPVLAFPPDGAEVERLNGRVLVKLRGGTAPFTVMADGLPLKTNLTTRETLLEMAGAGFVTLSVIDAAGLSARARLIIR
ncbi:penicillin-binding protein 1C [Gemmobacter sp. JM10B15]|uniref:peptidoglycan glycosyltransferase n=2 Tax=Gemmobacter denitrificans TaxID=3123040 RepID=A0ABU8C0X1_9RHOB